MPDTSHFFHRRLIDLRGAIKNGVRPYLPPTAAGMSDGSRAPRRRPTRRRRARRMATTIRAQHRALRELDRIHAALLDPPTARAADGLLGKQPQAPLGLYLWGGVGRGKTFLIDLFFDGPAESPAAKRRTHFHRFMREVHAQLRAHAGERDPLVAIARTGAGSCAYWCWTSSSSATSAMRCCSAACSNTCSPRAWCWSPRPTPNPGISTRTACSATRFLPAIALIEQHCSRALPGQRARLPAARADAFAGLPHAAGRAVRRLAGAALARTRPRPARTSRARG